MSHSTAPAFQFYPKDFLADGNVAGMTLQERGAYITLLCLCWQDGSIPADYLRLSRMLGVSLPAFRKLWPALERCFTATGTGYIHKRLDREREKQENYRRRQSDKGKASAAHRKATTVEPRLNAGCQSVDVGLQPKGNSPISNLQSPISKDDPKEQDRRRGRGQPPMALGLRKLKVWRWMLDDWTGRLGDHGADFDLHQWLIDLDAGLEGVPPSQPWEFLDAAFMAEMRGRGWSVVETSSGEGSKRVAGLVAGGEAFLKRAGGR